MKKILLILFVLTLVGCSTKKDIYYFQDIDNTKLENIDAVYNTTKIGVNDILYVRVTSQDQQSAAPFQIWKSKNGGGNSGRVRLGSLKLNGYLVDKKGKINIPLLGKIYVEGKTPKEAEKYIKDKLKKYLKDAIVHVRIVNYKVTVLGEVSNPGTYDLTESHYTLPQILAKAGDLTINGRRDDVVIIRKKGDHRIVKHIDLRKSAWMNSPFYYTKQNDIIYVKQNSPRVKRAGFITSIGGIFSVISFLLSLGLIIFR